MIYLNKVTLAINIFAIILLSFIFFSANYLEMLISCLLMILFTLNSFLIFKNTISKISILKNKVKIAELELKLKNLTK
jgi:hypothetical protein